MGEQKVNAILCFDPGVAMSYCMAVQDNNAWSVVELATIEPLRFKVRSRRAVRNRRVLNSWKLNSLIRESAGNTSLRVVSENIQPMPGRGVVSTATFLRTIGILEGICIAHCVPYEAISPSVWKRALGLSKQKDKSLAKAKMLFPHWAEKISNHNLAEALLLLYYYLTSRIGCIVS